MSTRCVACDNPLLEQSNDELCTECRAIVIEYNQDLYGFDGEEEKDETRTSK